MSVKLQVQTMVKQLGIWIIVLLLGGCASQARRVVPSAPQRSSPVPVLTPTPSPSAPTALKISLILNQLDELKVKQGDLVFKGQILVDRGIIHQDLEQERQTIQQQLVQLENKVVTPTAVPTLNTAAEETAVQQAQERLRQAEAAITRFKQNSPYTDLARQQLSLPAEEEKLAALETERRQAQAAVDDAIALLNAVQVSPPPPPPPPQNSSAEKAKLQQRLQEIAAKLKDPELVQSSHTGTIKTVKTVKQPNGKIKADLTLVPEVLPPAPNGLPTLPTSPQLQNLPTPPATPQPQGIPTLPPPLPNSSAPTGP